MKKILIILLTSNLMVLTGIAQEFEIKGRVGDSKTNEPLIGATIYIEPFQKGTLTDTSGHYAYTLPEGRYSLRISFIGYESKVQTISISKNVIQNILLNPSSQTLDEVVIQSDPLDKKLQTSQMSVNKLTMKEAKLLPALFGEVDIIKTLQLKPGVQSGSEGTSGLYIRGGGTDQNLILLDKAVVYNPSHLFGFFSIFNSDAVKDVELYKGGFPAQFGGRLSSVVDVGLRDANKEKFSGSGGVGMIASRLTLETPINKNSAIILSGRRTYVDVFTKAMNRANKNKKDYDPIPDYFFYDLNGKITYDIGKKDKVSLTGYYGNDVFKFNDNSFNFNFVWGNSLLAGHWTHAFNKNLTSITSFTYSKYFYQITNSFDVFRFKVSSEIRDLNGQLDFNYYLNEKHAIKFGASSNWHQFSIGRISVGSDDEKVSFNSGDIFNATELGAYVSDDFRINKTVTLNGGIRLSGFFNNGKFYYGLEPRASAKFSLSDQVALKGSYAKMYQYVHLVSNSSSSLPTDIWYPSDKSVRPQISDQVAGGISIITKNKKILFTNEFYYKWMNRQIDFKDGAQLFINPTLSNDFVFGKGNSYGNEIYLEKKQGKTTGWIGYTLSWSWRKFDAINGGRKYHPRYDRRHDVSVVVMHQINKRISLSSTWIYGTGNAATLPSGKYFLQEINTLDTRIVPLITDRNAYRMAPYHRLDLGIIYRFFPRWGESDLTLSVYNLYNRRNPYFIYIDEVKNDEGIIQKFQGKQVSLFPIIPSLTYNFKF